MLLPGKLLEGLVAVPVGGGRARAGLEIDHSEPSGSRVAISRAGRRPRAHKAAAASSVGGRQIQGFDGGLEGGGGLLVLVRVGVFLDLARQDAGGRGLVVR